MSQSNQTISLPKFVSKLPVFLKGMPSRAKGLYLANRKPGEHPVGLGVCLELACKRNPGGTALIYEAREYTYTQLNAWVNRFANGLSAMGVRKGDVIAICIENRPELLACIAAVAKVGAISALVNTSQRGGVLRHSLELVSPARVIVGAELFSAVDAVADCLPEGLNKRLFLADEDTLQPSANPSVMANTVPTGWIDLAAEIANCSSVNPITTSDSRASDACCYFYTSGTTGLPKAAILSHGRFMKSYAGVGLACLQLKPIDRAYVTLPFYHGTALIIGWGSVLAGAAGLVISRQFSASQFWPEVRRSQATAIAYVGELCRYLLAQPESPQDRQHRVKMMFGNGLRPNQWHAFKKRFGIHKVMEFYGSSEGNVGFLNVFNHDCTVGFTTIPYAIVEYDLDQDEVIRHKDGFLRKVAKGQVGLLLGEITDKSPFDGYTDPAKTEQTILRNVFSSGDAWFNTGDLMRDQGFHHAQFVDRLGDTYRWKGQNVSTTEVENCISQFHQVIDAVVFGVEIPNTNGRAGMVSMRIKEDEMFDEKAFYQYVSEYLPAYAIPLFLRISAEMETTGTFKYKKSDLKKTGYDLTKLTDLVWVCLPGSKCFKRLEAEEFVNINKGTYRF